MKNRIELFGITIDDVPTDAVLNRIDEMIRDGSRCHLIHTANVNHVRLFRTDHEFAAIYNKGDLITCDSMVLLKIARLLGKPLKNIVTGSGLTEEICRQSERRGYKIYFLGAGKEVPERAKDICERIYPCVNIVGCYSPERSEILDEKKSMPIVEKVNKSGANILFVAFGAPIQEKWMGQWAASLHTPVAIGVGGSIDYLGCVIKRPPVLIRKLCLEWAARLIQNPRRYAKRYLLDSVILYYTFLEILRSIRLPGKKVKTDKR